MDDRLEELLNQAKNYADSSTTSVYSVSDFRLIYNIGDADFALLRNDKLGASRIELIEQKAKLNLRVRLLSPEIKPAEVNAIRAYMELEEGISTNSTHTYNLQFAKTAEEMASIVKTGHFMLDDEDKD